MSLLQNVVLSFYMGVILLFIAMASILVELRKKWEKNLT